MPDALLLPIDDVLPDLRRALDERSVAVLEAAPGAGKTTRVPLALLNAPWLDGRRIIMLEPRRLAARNAATYMARLCGEQVGETVGYRVRGESRVGPRTRIEIVTEGILARLRASDAALMDYGIVIFDEFHERSLHADLALALVLQTQELLRPELRVLVMSATLDGVGVAALMRDEKGDAPVVRSAGRMFPVETHYRPPRRDERLEQHTSRIVREVVAERDGDVLVFLPGAAEQRRVAHALGDAGAWTTVHVLHGTQSFAEQEAAIAPAQPGTRKIVLATSVAETSLTIEGVRTVVDAGYSRLPRYSARTGLTRLDTVRVSKASADQRRGRAGRVASGWCYRLWDQHEDIALSPRTRPEILDADLSALALELASAGVIDAAELRWLDSPPTGAMEVAQTLLRQLGAVDDRNRITGHGALMAQLPTAPRIAHMILVARQRGLGVPAVHVAALLEERDILEGDRRALPADLRLRVELLARMENGGHSPAASRDALHRVRETARDIARRVGVNFTERLAVADVASVGLLLALAYPERIAQRRLPTGARDEHAGKTNTAASRDGYVQRSVRYLMRNGSGVQLAAHDALSSEPYLAVADLEGTPPEHNIVRAAPVALDDLRHLFEQQIERVETVEWNEEVRAVRSWSREQLGALVLDERRTGNPAKALVRATVVGMLGRTGIDAWPWPDRAKALRARLAFVAHHDPSWPSMSGATLTDTLEEWLAADLDDAKSWNDLAAINWHEALLSRLTWQQRAQLDELAPTHVEVPTGSRIPVDYSDPDAPLIAVRLQELFGWPSAPMLMNGRVPLTLQLLSPANRPVQVTRDLAGFWKNSYFEVRREMRGRYPRHAWPEDPMAAEPTRRAKPRGT